LFLEFHVPLRCTNLLRGFYFGCLLYRFRVVRLCLFKTA
jgi:hypothetical protein